MLNTASLNAVNNSGISSGRPFQRFVKPLYDSYCFSNIPPTIEFLLTGQGKSALPLDVFGKLPTRYSKVILFFIDGFGWRFFERYASKYNFLRTILSQGVASKLTSQFPSTTAAHVTTIHTSLSVAQSGIYEWNYYEPVVDEMISPLLFSYAGDKERDTLRRSEIPAEAFFPRQTFYSTLKTKGITPYIFQHEAYTPSTYSKIVYRGATVVSYKSLTDALQSVSEVVLTEKAPSAYYFLYFDRLDTICHHYGPNSRQFDEAVDTFLTTMDSLFYSKMSAKLQDTLFILVADHGQVEVDPRSTCYLNKLSIGIERHLQTNMRGKLLVPAGSARDMFLYIKEESLDEALALLRKRLEGTAEVYRTSELVAQHFFSMQEPSKAFLGRVGNGVILPYKYESVWWYEEGRFDMHFSGHHGGLTPDEMEIPFLVLPF